MIDTFHKPGRWLRVNIHTHTTNSDGGYTPQQAVAHYRDTLKYHAIFITDHRKATPLDGLTAPGDDFCVIPGVETDGTDPETGLYHLLALGVTVDQGFAQENTPLQAAVDWVNAQGGLAVFAHPYWTGQRHDALTRVEGAAGLEVYNHVCLMDTGKALSPSHWDALLTSGQRAWGFASDDTHFRPGLGYGGGGWIMVRAAENTPGAILAAIKAGDFYASTGPDFIDITRSGGTLTVKCSPVARIAFTGQMYFGKAFFPPNGAEHLTEATHTIKKENFVRVTLTGADGSAAWSQPLFLNR
ncbi:MAG: CehA/McbA family metallohydrolase [Anaerolineae bacterium]|nr:CehA/McbA family metallohydrolase [Anaerolineae bacterium]